VTLAWTAPEAVRAFRRPAGPTWEFTMLDADGAWVGGPGLTQLVPGPWFELFDIEKLERAATIRIRIHEGTRALGPPDTE